MTAKSKAANTRAVDVETPTPDPEATRPRELAGWLKWALWFSVVITSSMASMVLVAAFERLVYGDEE